MYGDLNRAVDFSDKTVIFGSQKIKKQKLVGYPQDVDNIEFNIKEQRYYFNNKTPFTEIDGQRNNSLIASVIHNESEK